MKNKIIRQIDELGRLVIPAQLREIYGLKPTDKVRLVACDEGIFICREVDILNDDNER